MDYYPYGSERITTGINTTKRHYIGEIYDSATSLNYLNARYYNNEGSKFLSIDQTFWDIGDENALKKNSLQEQKVYLSNPQQMNSYSYAVDNPIIKKDPTGRNAAAVGTGAYIFGGGTIAVSTPVIVITAVVSVFVLAPTAVQWVMSDPQSGYETTPSTMLTKGGSSETRWGGQRQIPDIGWPGEPPMGPEDMFPNLNPNLSPKEKAALATLVGITIAGEYYTAHHEAKEKIQTLKTQSESKTNKMQSGNSNKTNSPQTSNNSKPARGYIYIPKVQRN